MATAQQPQPEVTVYRSWRPPNVTFVEGMFRVDPELLGTTDCRYGVQLTVRDERHAAQREQWTGSCPENRMARSRPALETFQFQVVPATYTVRSKSFRRPARAGRTRTVTVRALPRIRWPRT
jgi:hypothetical protein